MKKSVSAYAGFALFCYNKGSGIATKFHQVVLERRPHKLSASLPSTVLVFETLDSSSKEACACQLP